MEGPLQGGDPFQSLESLPTAERLLAARDAVLAAVIAPEQARWPVNPTEDPVWGLIRIIVAQQISTAVACRLAERIRSMYPMLTTPSAVTVLAQQDLRALGIPERRAQCCIAVLRRSDELRARAQAGQPWQDILAEIKGVGPWTLAVFRIMVLRDPDVLPLGDVGLERAVANVYGPGRRADQLGENWRPFRSVACWYLWRTLGNDQLG